MKLYWNEKYPDCLYLELPNSPSLFLLSGEEDRSLAFFEKNTNKEPNYRWCCTQWYISKKLLKRDGFELMGEL